MDVEARQFPFNVGYNEDPATGVAAGALGLYLAKYSNKKNQNSILEFKIGQGFAMGKPSIIYTEVEVDQSSNIIKAFVGGFAEILN